MTEQAILPPLSQEAEKGTRKSTTVSEVSTKIFTQETTLLFKDRAQELISMTLEDIAKIMLDPNALKKCYTLSHVALLNGKRRHSMGSSIANEWKKATRGCPNISWSIDYKFEWAKARSHLMKKVGFTEVNYVGPKSTPTGLKLKSELPDGNEEIHIKRVGAFRKEFKNQTKNSAWLDLPETGCVVQQRHCDRKAMQLYMEYSK